MAKLDQININGTTYEIVPEIAPLFDATKAYAANDCVIKDAVLYRFTTAHAAGAWIGTDAEEITVGEEITNLKADFDAQSEMLSVMELEQFEPYYKIIIGETCKSTTGAIQTTSGGARTDYIPVDNAGSFSLSQTSGIFNYVLFKADKTKQSSATSLTTDPVVIPDDAVYLIVSGNENAVKSTTITLYDVSTPLSDVTAQLAGKQDKIPVDTWDDDTLSGLKSSLSNIAGVTHFPGNLINPFECVNNTYIIVNSGNEATNQPNYYCTGFIPVTAGTRYKSNIGRNHVWYDSTKARIGGSSGTAIQRGITAPDNATYIRFTVNKSADNSVNPFDLYFTDTDHYNTNISIDGMTISPLLWCYGKTINWIGDSIVDGPDFDEEVCTALNLTKLTTDAVDGGINGSTIALRYDGSDGRNALCIRYANMPDNADIIAVSCGTNDWMYAWCPVGDIESTENTTFYGALKTLCAGLIAKYPQKVIFFTTPIKRAQAFESGNGGEYTADGVMTTPFSKNKYGKTLGDYANIIKEVCGYYSIPVLDMYRESLLNPHLTAQQDMFDSVYTHPNVTGQKIMARRVAGWLTQLGYLIG